MAKKKTGSTFNQPDAEVKESGHLAKVAEAKGQLITIPQMKIGRMKLKLIGDTPLICHAWAQKQIKQMEDKHAKNRTKGNREKRDPEQEYRDSLYPFPGGGFGFPALAFKMAAVTACSSLGKEIPKTLARQAFHVESDHGQLVKIIGEPTMRQDTVRVGIDSADLRYRGEFDPWEVVISITYNEQVMSAKEIVNLFHLAGFAVGVGDWRVEKDGNSGRFHVGAMD